MSIRHTAILSAIALSLATAPVLARGHMHCEIRPWGPIELTPTPNMPFPVEFLHTNTTLSFNNIVIPLPAPAPSSIPNCMYEISDITMIRVTLVLGSGSEIEFSSFSTTFPAPLSPTNPGPYLFNEQVNTKVFTFRSHDTQGSQALELTFPSPTLSFSMVGQATTLGASRVIGATIQISGNHYFVPEPAGATLIAAGILCAARHRRMSRA
jgi:hypothetical protein